MCHEGHVIRERLEAALLDELDEAETADEDLALLNEERETDIEVLTDGGRD